MIRFRGVIPPIVTPFREEDEELDEDALHREAQYLIDVGVHGIAVCGSVGEGNSVTVEEAYRAYRAVVEESRGRVPVLAGIITDSTRDAVERGLAAKEAGVSALMITPIIYRTPSEEGLLGFYRTIGERVGLPMLIYDIDKTKYIPTDQMLRLFEVPGMCGIKQSGGDIHKVADLICFAGDRVSILTALDDVLFATFALGVHGTISAVSSLFPGLCVEMWQAVEAGDYDSGRRVHEKILPVWRALQGETDGQRTTQLSERVKEALNQQGRKVGIGRSPLIRLPAHECERIRAAQVAAGLIG